MKVCLEPGCHELTTATRCATHTRHKDRARGTRQQRGYDARYDRERKRIAQAMTNGKVYTCWRCGHVVYPHQLSLGHCDDDRSVLHGAEHLACNLANTRGGCPHPSHATPWGGTPIGAS